MPLVVMAGLQGTGKSTLAREMLKFLEGIVLDKDVIRAALFPPSYLEYSTRQDDFCFSLMLEVAEYLLQQHPGVLVILDGRTFSKTYQLEQASELAEKLSVPVKIIECVCSEEAAKKRLEHDNSKGTHLATNRNFALYLSVKEKFQPIAEPKLVVDTNNKLEECVQLCLSYLGIENNSATSNSGIPKQVFQSKED